MALYVIRPSDPAVGTEWLATVPGQYLYDITGITATLDSNTGAPVTAADSSGSGNDLAYQNPDVVFGVPGYVSGNTMIQNALPSSGWAAIGTVDMVPLTGNDLFFNVWTNLVPPLGTAPTYVAFSGATSFIIFACSRTGAPVGSAALSLSWFDGATTSGIGVVGVFPTGRHMVSVRLDLGASGGQFYLDGSPFGPFNLASAGMPALDATGTMLIAGRAINGNFPLFDEIAVGANPTVDADYTNLFAQRNNFANYNAAQMAMIPDYYYHLDETGVGIGRQVCLEITDGTNVVELIPTGFVEGAGTGPFFYAWQPKLASSSQTVNEERTTVATPRLILPAGYTVGPRTLDLGSADRWSDIAIWWDSRLMDTLNNPHPYAFPPGAHLVWEPAPGGIGG